jgi:hypothetical protein
MPLKNMTRFQFLILSMIIIDGSIASTIIFSNIGENLKFVGLMMMFIASAFIVMFGALHIVKE